jgi:hypothetical protein
MLKHSLNLKRGLALRRNFSADYYRVLGVNPGSSLKEIENAFAAKTRQLNFTIGNTSNMNIVASKGRPQHAPGYLQGVCSSQLGKLED